MKEELIPIKRNKDGKLDGRVYKEFSPHPTSETWREEFWKREFDEITASLDNDIYLELAQLISKTLLTQRQEIAEEVGKMKIKLVTDEVFTMSYVYNLAISDIIEMLKQ